MLKRFIEDESGATAIEYGLIIAVLSLAIIGSLTSVMEGIGDVFGFSSGLMEDAIAQ